MTNGTITIISDNGAFSFEIGKFKVNKFEDSFEIIDTSTFKLSAGNHTSTDVIKQKYSIDYYDKFITNLNIILNKGNVQNNYLIKL